MAARTDIHRYIETVLDVPNVDDYCANGLQVQGKAEIRRLVTGVTASQAFIDKAIALKAAKDGANIVIAAKTAEPHPKLSGTICTAAKEGYCFMCSAWQLIFRGFTNGSRSDHDP